MPPVATPLSPAARQAALERMATTTLDVLVVGGGVVGAGAALDAVTRGLAVGLLEARDFGAGTSSRSSKLVHGGLRYLKQLNVRLVFEALRERRLILDSLAPHLARPVPFVYPLQRPVLDRLYVGLGVGVYDVLGAGRGVPSHLKHLSRQATASSFRSGRPGAVRGGILFYEGQLDDARHTMTLARTAAAHGALVAASTQVTGFLRTEAGAVLGVVATDLETGRELRIRAHRVVNATGVWTEELAAMLGRSTGSDGSDGAGVGGVRVQASKGVHILVPRSRIDSDTGLITETEKSLLFVIPCPWRDDMWVIGTTDTPWDHDRAHPAATRADIDYILEHVNTLLADPLTRDDVVGVFTGLRPLVAAGDASNTAALSREHSVVRVAPGLVAVVGGKYTTYRVMAADAVDAAVKGLPGRVKPSRTAGVPLVGADGYHALLDRRADLAAAHGLGEDVVLHLLRRYGTAVAEVLDLVRERPDLGRPLAGAPPHLRAEAHYAVSHEGALHLDDVLVRRLRASVDTPSRGLDAAQEVAAIMAGLLGWDDATTRRELDHYTERVRAERESQTLADDAAADAARRQAEDVRPVAAVPAG